jgi:protein CLEC16A
VYGFKQTGLRDTEVRHTYFLFCILYSDFLVSLKRNYGYWDRNPSPDSNSTITAAVDEIEDNLYYFSDVISAGIPDVERLITDSILTLLIFPVLLPSLRIVAVNVWNFTL